MRAKPTVAQKAILEQLNHIDWVVRYRISRVPGLSIETEHAFITNDYQGYSLNLNTWRAILKNGWVKPVRSFDNETIYALAELSPGQTIDNLDRWERNYLVSSIGRTHICIPVKSKVADRLIEKGVIRSVGLVSGGYAEFEKTPLGNQMLKDFVDPSEVDELVTNQ
jgi:hypothetical protein